MAADLAIGVRRHLIQTGDNNVEFIPGLQRIQIRGFADDPVSHAIAKCVGQRICDCLLLNVNCRHFGGTVQRKLDRQQTCTAAYVHAVLVLTDFVIQQVLPGKVAALGRDKDSRVAMDLGQRQRKYFAPFEINPGIYDGRRISHSRLPPRFSCRLANRFSRARALQRLCHCLDMRWAYAAAATKYSGPFCPPHQRHVGIVLSGRVFVQFPFRVDIAAQVRIRPQRQICEIGKPWQCARDAIGGQTIDQDSRDTVLFQFRRQSAKIISLRSAPELPMYAAHTVPTPTKTKPDRNVSLENERDRFTRVIVLHH